MTDSDPQLSLWRGWFLHHDTGIHLNHAGLAPIARSVGEAATDVTRELMRDDTLRAYINHHKREDALRGRLGEMLGTAAENIGFVRNTSHGLAIAAQALPFEAGENVVAVRSDYPSNIYPWQAQAWRGVTTRLVSPRSDGRIVEEDLMDACDDRTAALAVSWVHWGTGQRLDLARLGQFCRNNGIYFVVDIVQGFGALQLNVEAAQVDIATAGCHKWLMAPAGLGVLYVHPETMHDLLPVNIGWNSVEDPLRWDSPHFEDLRQTPQRFEEGSPSLMATAALLESVELLGKVGLERVEQRVLSLARRARNGLAARGMRLAIGPQESGIVGFNHLVLDNDEVQRVLEAGRVRCAVRAGYVRFSPHFYNTEEEIDKAVALVP